MRKKLLKCTALGITAATMLTLSGCSPHRSPSVPPMYVEDGIRANGSLPGSVDELTLGERQYYTAQLLNDIRTLNTENLRQFTSDRAVLDALDAIRTDPDGKALWQEIFSALRYDSSGNVAVYPSPLYTLGKCMASRHDFPADVQQLSAAQVRNILQHEWQDAPYVGTELSAFVSGWRIADGHLDADLSVLFRLMGLSSPADMVTDGLISYGRLMLADRPVTGADEAMPHHKAVASLDLDEIRDLLWMHREDCRTQSLFFWTAYVEKYILHDANRAVMQQWMHENCETVTTGDCVAVFFKATPAHSFPFSMMSADAQQALAPLKLATVETVSNFPADFQHNFGWLWQVIDTLIGLGQLK